MLSKSKLETVTPEICMNIVLDCKDGIIEINRGKGIPKSNNSVEVKMTR